MRIMLILAVLLWAGDQPCLFAPTPHVHVTNKDDGGMDVSASCPDGWQVHLTQKATDDFNKDRSTSAAINMLADGSCVKKSTTHPGPDVYQWERQ
jgi:hypothetical protein